MVEIQKEKQEIIDERFPRPEEFRKAGQDIWNKLVKMRQPLHVRFMFLAIAMELVRPFNQVFDEYTIDQLKVLANLYKTELDSVNEALMRKIPKE